MQTLKRPRETVDRAARRGYLISGPDARTLVGAWWRECWRHRRAFIHVTRSGRYCDVFYNLETTDPMAYRVRLAPPYRAWLDVELDAALQRSPSRKAVITPYPAIGGAYNVLPEDAHHIARRLAEITSRDDAFLRVLHERRSA